MQNDYSHNFSTGTFLLLFLFTISPDWAAAAVSAAENNAITDTICVIINELSGPVGRAVAIVAIIFLGFALFLGKVTWGLSLACSIGVATVFGAGELVEMLGGVRAEGSCDAAV